MARREAAHWFVFSRSEPEVKHKVTLWANGQWACGCKGWIFAKKKLAIGKPDCFHICKIKKEEVVPVIAGVPTQVMVNNQVARNLDRMTTAVQPKVVLQTPTVLVIQTRREVCLEED